ncbi:MAG TPA: deoxyribodipyrimidine photo-lyase [Lutibacter sp.]|nr:deoxyribodipyrimidine photo-lyase [Lutibacter sp.]
MIKEEISVFWFRRDLRLEDNCALFQALNSKLPVLPIFIFDEAILNELPKDDSRVNFIYDTLKDINNELLKFNASLYVKKGNPVDIWSAIFEEFNVKNVFFNKDYEPYAKQRDEKIKQLCKQKNSNCFTYKDQVIFEEAEIVKADGLPYSVYTPYKNKWLEKYNANSPIEYKSETLKDNFLKSKFPFPSLSNIGFVESLIKVLPSNSKCIKKYQEIRDIPSVETSNASVFLRFGTISVRKLVDYANKTNQIYLSELIWREFFMQILFHYPKVVNENFKSKYNFIPWRNNEAEFKLWCEGRTGYPIVDAGMRQLNKTGYMHNRVRMITASFLCKHLLIDWRWGEAYFASTLLDFELSSNNGNWQWVAGTGCDSAPYFRVFNPTTQQEKFDPDLKYIKKWIPNFTNIYIPEIVEHKFARDRYLNAVKSSFFQ